jgi:uncharacterized membrane protein YcaP (DUF421 family)
MSINWHDLLNVNWHDIFYVTVPLVIEKILRPILVYIFLVIGLRIAGKRELAQLNPFDLVVLLTLSNTVQNAIIGDDNTVTGGVIGASTLLFANYMLVRFVHKHKSIERLVEGDRDCLIKHGKILKDHLNRELMSRTELAAAAHRQGITSLAEVDNAILEPTGTITFVQKTPTSDEIRHHELLDVMDHIRKELALLQATRGEQGTP